MTLYCKSPEVRVVAMDTALSGVIVRSFNSMGGGAQAAEGRKVSYRKTSGRSLLEAAHAHTRTPAYRRPALVAMIERLYDVGHKLVVSALLGTSAIGMTYIGFAGFDVYGRWKKHKALKQEQKQD